MQGIVSNVQKFSIHDGPGIRTTVFLKGCNLQCLWCHNPETINPCKEIQILSEKCIGCNKCIEICPFNAHKIQNGKKVFFRQLCKTCGNCIKGCYAEALVMNGRVLSVDEVLKEIDKDHNYYEASGGGVTFSGGEPLLQGKFLKELLKQCKRKKYHTAVDTAGNVPWETFKEILPYTDLFLYDIKAIDTEKHISTTGVNNDIILENLKMLAGEGVEIWIRIPVIPGVNDTESSMEGIAAFIDELKVVKVVEFLPFHRIGEGKYKSLGMEYKAKDYGAVPNDLLNTLMGTFENKGLKVIKS